MESDNLPATNHNFTRGEMSMLVAIAMLKIDGINKDLHDYYTQKEIDTLYDKSNKYLRLLMDEEIALGRRG
jgi:hypothetical protein